MHDFWNIFLLEYVPYIALAVLIFGTFTRLVFDNKSIQATSTQLIDNTRWLKIGSYLWHYGIILVLLGHIFGLFTPEWAYDWCFSPALKRILAIILGGAFGLMAFTGLFILTVRRFYNPAVSVNSTFRDKFIVVLLLCQIAIGLTCTGLSAAGPLSNYLSFDYWAQGIITLQPFSWTHIAHANVFYKIHIVNGFFIFILFPYSKLMHFLVLPWRYFTRRGRQLVWRRGTVFNE